MRWTWALVGTLATGLIASGVVAGTTAQAETTICAKYGQTRTQGGYVAQNNLWGADTPQCISVSGDGFSLTRSEASKPTNGAPASYPSVFWGCHYATCTTGFTPLRADGPAFAALRTSVELRDVDAGAYDASLDIWFDPTPRTDGQDTGAEVMVWLNHRGGVQPVGSKVGTVRLAGADWDVWSGNIGWNVVSYVRTTPSSTLATPVRDFYADAVARGYAQTSWYLTSVQAGFEPWVGGTGLALTSFAVTTDGSVPGPVPSTATPSPLRPTGGTPPTSTTPPAPTAPTNPPGGTPRTSTTPMTTPTAVTVPAACRVTTRRDEWPGGFVRYLEITNTGASTVQGWTLTADAAPGQALASGWGATWAQAGGRLSARNLDWNATVAPGGRVSLGYQGGWSGTDPEPTGWALSGVPCSTG